MRKLSLALLLSLFGSPLLAAKLPEVTPGESMADEVIIQPGEDGETRIEEYREDGQVYRVKVVPTKGRPYYLVDSDGNGSLDKVEWILFQW